MPQETPSDKFVQQGNPVKPTGFDKFVQQPLAKEEARGLFQQGAFRGDSQYDKGLVFGVEQAPLRARNQPWYDQVGNNAAKLIPAVGLGIIENAGYIGELFSNDQDYTNALTEFATKTRQDLEETLPAYRQNPEEIFDWKDSGWWAQHGMGLAESIGEFLVTGAGVGGVLGKSANLLNNAIRGGKLTNTLLQGTAQLGTASTLAYTEGAMSGALVYKDVYENEISIHGNIELANEKAAEAASKTVQLNTIINTGLNLTSVTPLFKTLDNLYTTSRLGLNRKTGEKLTDWALRLDELEKAGVPQASFKKALALETLQEGIEEDVNLFAESEGRITGGIEKASSPDPVKRFFNKAFSEEGMLNFLLGAVGGAGQTLGMNFIPYRTVTNEDGTTSKVSNRTLAAMRDNEQAGAIIATLRNDIDYVTTKQKELNQAVQDNNVDAVNQARQDLFNVSMLKSIRQGTTEEFANELRSVAAIDNVTIGEDGKTEAMRQGFADNPQDNEFKTKAVKKASDLKTLETEYQEIAKRFPNPFVANEVFRQRLNLYSAQEAVDEQQVKNNQRSIEVAKLITDPGAQVAVEMAANVSALNGIIAGLEEEKALPNQAKRMLGNFKNSLMVEQKLLNDMIEADPKVKAQLEENKGAVLELMLARTPLIGGKEQVRQLKAEYNKLLTNKKETTTAFEAQQRELQNKAKNVEELQKQQEEKVKEQEDLKVAKDIKQQQYKEPVGAFVIQSSPTGGFDVVDPEAGVALSNHASVEEAREAAKEFNKRAEKETVRKEPTGKKVKTVPTPVVPKNKQKDPYQGKTKEDSKKEEELLENQLKEKNINEEKTPKANKVAYRAKESDDSPINPDYLILHSKEFGVGTGVTLKIAKETKFYKEGLPIAKVPIGVYWGEKLVGYVHLTSEEKPDAGIYAIREAVVNRGPIFTTIADKDFGVLNRSDNKHTTSEAMPIIKDVVINIDGVFMKGVKKPYEGISNKPVPGTDGHTYAVVETPNNKLFAIPLDTKRISPEFANSIMVAFQVFLHPDELTAPENALMEEIFQKYDVDVRTAKGFEKYFKSLLFNYNLGDPVDVAEKNARKDDHRWINFTGNGLRYLKTGGAITVNNQPQAKEIGKNSPPEIAEVALEEILDHISKMYYNVDIEQLQENKPVNLPIFVAEEGTLTYKDFSTPNYTSYVKTITETNVVGSEVKAGEYTYFINPRLYFDTAFLGTKAEENYGKPAVAVVAPTPKEEEKEPVVVKPTKPLKSKTKRLPKQGDSSLADDNIIKYAKRIQLKYPEKTLVKTINDYAQYYSTVEQALRNVANSNRADISEIARKILNTNIINNAEVYVNPYLGAEGLANPILKIAEVANPENKTILLHEIIHLYSAYALESLTNKGIQYTQREKDFAKSIKQIYNIFREEGLGYLRADYAAGYNEADFVHEFLSEALTEQAVIQALKDRKVSKTILRNIEVPTTTKLELSLFDLVMNAIYKLFGKVYKVDSIITSEIKQVQQKVVSDLFEETKDIFFDYISSDIRFNGDTRFALSSIFDDIVIPGFTPYTQNEVVNQITEQVLIGIAEDTTGRSFNEHISDYVNWAEDQILAGNTLYDPIVENIDRFRVLVKDKLDRIGLLQGIPLDQAELNIEGDTVSDGFYWEDDWVFRFDAKSNAQKQIKEFLLFIPKTEFSEGEYSEVQNYLGTISYMPYDEVFEELKAILSDTPNTWDAMQRELQEYQEEKPWVYNLLFQVNNFEGDKEQLINQFVSTFSSTYSASKTIIWDEDQGVYNFKIIDTDQNAARKVLLNKWKTNFNLGGFYNEVEDKLVINKDRVTEAVAILNSLKENPKGLKTFLASLGIEVSDKTVDALIEGKVSMKYEKHFTSKNGLFKLIEDRLAGKDANGLDFEEVVNPVVNNSAVRLLATIEVRNNPQVYSNSYINGEGNIVYSYSLGKFLTKQYDRLLPKPIDGKRDKSYIEQLMGVTFQSPIMVDDNPMYKTWLHQLNVNDEFGNYFNIAPFDTIKQSNSNFGVRLSDMSDIDLELTKWTLFQNRGQSVKGIGRIANYLFTIPAKTTSYTITSAAIDPNLSSSGSLGKEAKDALYSIALTELLRINSAKDRNIKTKRYKAGSQYFYFFPDLNKETLPEIWNSDGTVKLPTTKITIENGEATVEELIRLTIEQIIKENIDNKVKHWNDIGFVKEGELQYVDQYYAKNIKGIPEFKVRAAAADYVVNNTLAEFNMHQMFIGDPAIYFKTNVAKTWDEIGKRLAAMIAPGRDIALKTEDEKFISIKVKDRENGNAALNYAQLKARLGDLAIPYENINGTDAQEYTTVKEHLFVLYRSGLINTEVYKNITEKVKRLGDNLVLTKDELQTVLQPVKPVYVDSEVNTVEDVVSLEYVKSSSIPLLPQFTQGLELDDIRKAMQSLEDKEGYPVRLAFDSATKVGGVASIDIWDSAGKLKSKLNFSKHYKLLPRTGFRIQQDVPYDPNYEEVVKATQVTKLLFDSILGLKDFSYKGQSLTGIQLQEKWTGLHKRLFGYAHDELNKEILDPQGKLDIQKIQKLLVKEATIRAYSPAETAALSLMPDGTFEFPFWAVTSSKKYESILTSLYTNNIVKQKMHGQSLILVSEEAVKGKSKGVVYTEKYDPTTGLKPMRIGDNGEVLGAQVLIPWRFKADIKNYINSEGFIDTTKLPEDLLQQFGFRIPNQGHNSMSLIEVVGFLPEVMGDAVVASRNFITQMGSDFDIDKLYIYDYYTKEIDGKIVRDQIDNQHATKNDLLDIHKAVLSSEKVFNQVVTPLGNVKDSISAKYLKSVYAVSPTNYLSPDYKKSKYLESVDGKSMVGLESLASTLNSLMQGHNLYTVNPGSGERDFFVIGDEKGKRRALYDLSDPFNWKGQTKNSVISADQSGAVDNEKDPILSYINSNPVVAPARAFMRQVGVDTDWTNYLLAQSVIREVTDSIRKTRSSVGIRGRDLDKLIIRDIKERLTNEYIKTLSPSEASVFTLNDARYEPITAAKLKEAIEKPTPYTNLIAILKFEQAYNWGQSLQTIQSAINIESKGVGKSVLEVSLKADGIMRLTNIKDIANVPNLVGAFTEKGLEPSTYTGHIIKEGLLSADQVLGAPTNELFKYNSRSFKQVLKEFEMLYGVYPTADQSLELWEALKSYIYAKGVDANRAELFIGKDSLARRIKQYMTKSKDGATNPFLIRLNFEFGATTRKPDLISYNAAKEEFVDEISVYQGLISLIDNTNVEVAKIGSDLVSYFYLNGGLQKAREWGKYIHPAYLNSFQGGSFLNTLKRTDFQELSTIGYNTLISDFMLQYFQHKPYLLPTINLDTFNKLKPVNNKVILPDPTTADEIILKLRDDEGGQYVPLFAVKDRDAAKGYQLWIYDGSNSNRDPIYRRINVLGSTNFNEYSRDSRANSLVNSNYKAKVISVAPIKNKPKIDTKSVPTGKWYYLTGDANDVVKRLKSKNPIVALFKQVDFGKYKIYQNNKLKDKSGVIWYGPKTIEFNPVNSRDPEETIIHELVHAVTVDAITSVDGLTSAQVKAVSSIKTIVDNLRTRVLNGELEYAGWKAVELKEFEDMLVRRNKNTPLTERQRSIGRELRKKYYGIASVPMSGKDSNTVYKEFLAELFSSPDFQEVLNKIKYDGKKSLLDRLIELINQILKGFGATEGSVFDAALHDAIVIIADKTTKTDVTSEVNPTSTPTTVKKSIFDIKRKDAPPKGSYDYALADSLNEDYKALLDQFSTRLRFIDQSISKAFIAEDQLLAQQLINRKEEVNKELEEFEEKQIFSSVIILAEKDLNQVEAIFNKGGVSHNDINYTRRVIQMWLESPELVLTATDKADANQRAKDIYKVVGRATELSKRWEGISRTALLQAVKNETGMTHLTQEVIDAQNNVNALTANLLDISRSGNILLSVMDKWMRESIYKANLEAKVVHDKTIKLADELKKVEAFKKDGYYLFAQIDEDGKLTGELVQALKSSYYSKRNELIEHATTAGSKASRKAAWQDYFKWLRENHTFFDIRKLFKQDNEGAYKYDPDQAYVTILKKQFDNFDELLAEQQAKITNYNERLALKIQSLEGNPEANREVEKWKVRYDPAIYLRNTLSSEYSSQVVDGEFIKNEGHEFVVKRANKKWEDEKYNKIQANATTKEFYDHFAQTLNNLYKFIPPHFKHGVTPATIPGISKTILETYNEEGMSAGLTTANNELIEAVSAREEEIEFKKLIIPIENKVLGIRYMSELSPEEKSYDLGRVLNIFASEALMFKHKSTVEDSIKLAYSIIEQGYNTIKAPEKIGMIKRFGEITKGKSAKDLMDQVEYAINAFYGDRKKLQGNTNKKVYTNKAKSKVSKLKAEIETNKLSTESEAFIEELKKKYELKLETNEQIIEAADKYLVENTRYVVGSKVGDVLLQYMQMKGMGWNIFSSVTNVVFGWFSNFIHANAGVDFNNEQLLKANRIMLASTGKGLGVDNKVAFKINSLMVKYDILKELNDAGYRPATSTNRARRGIENLAPYELQRRGEYYVQGMTMIASMLNTKVIVNGVETTVWDAYDEFGNFKETANKDWNYTSTDKTSGKEQFKLKFKLDQINKAIHGNYDTASPVRIKQGILGRATMQFRSWIAEGIANRIEGRKYDLLLGRERQGRWRTYTDLGFKDSFRVLLRVARGKSIDGIVSTFDRDIVVENMKRNLAEIYQSLTLLGLYMLVSGFDDEDDEWKKKARNFTLNQILRLQDDIEFYYSPLAIENITQNFVPVFTLVRDSAKFVDALEKGIVDGEWEYQTGKKSGENRILWTGAKIFPFGSSFVSFINKTENEEGFRK